MTQAGETVDPHSGTDAKTATTVAMDSGRITLARDLILFLFGTPGQPRFWPMWDDLCQGASAAVVLADTRRLDVSFPAVNYFENDCDVPFVVAVNLFDGRQTHPSTTCARRSGSPARCRFSPLTRVTGARARGPCSRASATPWKRPRRFPLAELTARAGPGDPRAGQHRPGRRRLDRLSARYPPEAGGPLALDRVSVAAREATQR